MRFAIGVVLALAAAVPATACNSEILEVLDWQVEKFDHPLLPYKLTAQVQYDGPKPYRMIHAGVIIDDVLRQNIGQVNLERDGAASPGETVEAAGQVMVRERLATINRDDTVARACVWSIVYDDGEVVEF
jgi:hypothetical protein